MARATGVDVTVERFEVDGGEHLSFVHFEERTEHTLAPRPYGYGPSGRHRTKKIRHGSRAIGFTAAASLI